MRSLIGAENILRPSKYTFHNKEDRQREFAFLDELPHNRSNTDSTVRLKIVVMAKVVCQPICLNVAVQTELVSVIYGTFVVTVIVIGSTKSFIVRLSTAVSFI